MPSLKTKELSSARDVIRSVCREIRLCFSRTWLIHTKRLILPEIFEPVGRHGGVAHRMLNILMSQLILDRSGIMPLRREVIAARMTELVGMGHKGQCSHLACSRHNLTNRPRGQGRLALGDEHIRGVRIGALEF